MNIYLLYKINMELYDLTLKKEVARECAWGIMGTISRIKDKIGETEFLKIVQKKIGLEIKDIPTMNLKEVEELNVKCKFLMGVFSEMEEI